MNRRPRVAAAASLALLAGSLTPNAVSAQSPGSEAAAVASEPRSACELLDPDQAAEILGLPVTDGQDLSGVLVDDGGWLTHCAFFGGLDASEPVVEVTLASGPAYTDLFGAMRVEPEAEPVDGFGEEAVIQMTEIWGLDQPIGAMHVRVGEIVVGLQLGITGVTEDGALVQLGDEARQRQALVDLAGMALDRLDPGGLVPAARVCELLAVADASAVIAEPLATAGDVAETDDWGPACHYRAADDRVRLFLGVTTDPAAIARFDACAAVGEPAPGVGEAAFIGSDSDCGAVFVGSYVIERPLVARSGDTIVTVAAIVGEWLGVNPEGSREAQVAVARGVFEGLGLDPGSTPAPFDASVLERPCDLVTPAEVAAIVGVPITGVTAIPADAMSRVATCLIHAQDGNARPLVITVTAGEEALAEWATFATYRKGAKVPVAGLGDRALTEATERPDVADSDHPLASLWVLRGDVLLELDMGSVERLPDYTNRAPGTPDEQLAMLRQLAELILPRLGG